jgi:hypothetical protein
MKVVKDLALYILMACSMICCIGIGHCGASNGLTTEQVSECQLLLLEKEVYEAQRKKAMRWSEDAAYHMKRAMQQQ